MWAATAALCCSSVPPGSLAQGEQHPDLSGVWTTYIAPGQVRLGRGMRGPELPLTPEGQKKVAAYRQLVGATSDNPGAHCLGSGMPASMMFSGGYPMEIVQRPDLLLVIYEAWTEIRQLYLGARIIPARDRVPDRNGYSSARWDGDTLVVETTDLKEQEDQTYPHSDQARIVERYHLAKGPRGEKVLVDDWTLSDPVFYTQPVTAEKKWAYDPKGILLPYECNEEAWLDHLEALRKAQDEAATSRPATAAAAHP